MKNLLIVIPTYREQKNILILCKKLLSIKSLKYNLKILVVDDSDDLITQNLINSSKLKITFNVNQKRVSKQAQTNTLVIITYLNLH